MTDKLQQEDTVSADRKVRIIIDPATGKRKKTSAVMSRQNFDSEKFGNRNKVDDDEDNEQVKESAIQPTGTSQIDVGATERAADGVKDSKKNNTGQIQFVTGNQQVTSSTAIGNAQNMGIKKISEALVKRAITQIKVDKNVGTEEIKVNESCSGDSSDMDSCTSCNSSSSTRARDMARKLVRKQTMKEDLKGNQHKLDKNKNGKLDKQDFKLLRKEESELEEKLDLSKAEMGDVIKDFQKSDAPQFQGKGKEKRREMAIAAKLQSDRVNKEETTMSKTYAEFIEQLNEYNAKEGVYRHKGTYGGSYDSNDDHDDDEPKKPAAPAVKRGRGRPAGSKSGANQKVTTGKSYGGIATHSLNLPNSNR